MRKKLLSLVTVSVSTFWILGTCFAGTPGIVNYQGRVVVNGTNYNGTGQFKFAMVDGSNRTLWSHDGSSSNGNAPTSSVSVAVSQGLCSLMLGDTGMSGMTQPVPPAVFTNDNVYLRVWFDDGAHGVQLIGPDQRVAAVGYALQAASVQQGAVTAQMLADGSVTSGKIAAGAIKPHHIDDADETAYRDFLSAAQSLGGGSPLVLADLTLVTATNGVPPSLAFTVNGSAFGTVIGFTGSEGISQPYAYVVDVAYSGSVIDPATEVGRQGRLSFVRNGRTSTFGGVITGCNVASSGTNLLYTFRIESPLAWLALTADYRIYQNVEAPDAAATVYYDLTTNTYVASLTASYSIHENLIQYAETALNFFSRLLEREGVFYFFNQANNPPTLVLGDDPVAYLPAPNSPFAYYGNYASNVPPASERIRTFHKAVHESTLKSTLSGYNFKTPTASLLRSVTGSAGRGERFEFGTDPATQTYNLQLATARQERQSVVRAMASGSATAPDLRAGYTFTLSDTTGAGLGGAYLVTAVRHAGFCRVTNGVSTLYYGNEFEVIPAAQPFRPAVETPKPLAQVCTAVVTGPGGEKIHVDAYGRVKVFFHWDRYGVKDDTSSAWLRVASPMAGSTTDHAMMFLPRVGDEVLVSFIQGDPDQPVVTGSLYNNAAMPPYALPGNKWRSTIRSASQTGNFNEIRFDDTAGSEQMAILAGKDLMVDASHDFSIGAGNALSVSAPQISMSGNLYINGVAYAPSNSVSVWAAVAANGTVSAQQGIASVVNNQQGFYTVTLSKAASSASSLIPIAMPNLNALPTTPAAIRMAAVDQVTTSSFRVYIICGAGYATNTAFVVMVTGN